jgi:hypothetical protein
VDRFLGSGGTLSVEVLGVDLLSVELLGRLLVDELAELKVVKFMSTLCGLDLIFDRVVELRTGCLGGLSETLTGTEFSIFGGTIVRRGLEDETVLADFEASSVFPSRSPSFPIFRLGDGDLDDVIHDFLANVANDSDTVLVFSREALEIGGTGGMLLGDVLTASEGSCLSGDPFTLCIQDFGRATKDFLLPTLSSLGLSSLVRRLPIFPSFTSFAVLLFSGDVVGWVSIETTR